MPNPFQSLNLIPIMPTVLDVMQRQANVERINAGTNYTNAETQLLTNQIQSQKRMNDALANLATAKQVQQNTEQGLPDGMQAFSNTTMGKPIVDGYRSEKQDADQNRMLAGVARDAGNYVLQKQYEQSARDADNRAREWYAQGLKVAQDQRKEASSIAGSYQDDGSNIDNVITGLNGIDPSLTRGKGFDRDAGGNIIPGDKTTRAMNAIASQNMSRSEQLSAQREADKIKQDAVRNQQADRRADEQAKRDDMRAAALQHSMNVQDRRLALAEKAAEGATDDSDLVSDGAMVATGMPMSQAIPGWGTAAVNRRAAAKKEAIKQIKDETGMDDKQAGQELAQRNIDFAAGKSSTTQLNKMLGATRQAVSQLEFNAEQAKKILKDIPSTDLSPILNGIMRKEEYWTGDPKYSALYFYMHATAMESARILQGGQASIAQLHQGAAEEAKKWADISMTPKMFESVANEIMKEGEYRIKTYQDAMKQQRVGGAPAKPESAPEPTGKTIDWKDWK